MRILITGASGIVGGTLINKLKRLEKYQLILLVRKNKKYNINNNTNLLFGDLLDPGSLQKATLNVDTVIHLAGITHTNQQDLYYKINTVGTENLLKACHNNKVKKFIYISSRTASQNGGAYAISKFLAEKKVEQYQQNWIILSLAEVYGAGEKEAVSKLINLIKKNFFVPIIGNGQYLLAPVFVDDIINAIINALQSDNIYRKKYILAGPEEFTYNDMIDRISGMLGKERFKIYLPLFFLEFLALLFFIFKKDVLVRDQIPRLLCRKSADITLAKKDLNFSPRNFEAGIRKMIKLSSPPTRRCGMGTTN